MIIMTTIQVLRFLRPSVVMVGTYHYYFCQYRNKRGRVTEVMLWIVVFTETSFFVSTLYALMDSSFWFDSMNLGWFTVYFEGHMLKLCKKYCISFSEDRFCFSKQSRPWKNVALYVMRHFIWVFTVCQSTHLRVTGIFNKGLLEWKTRTN